METQTVQRELEQRHRTAMTIVVGFIVLDALLLAIAYFTAERLTRLGDPSIIMALWIGILLCGLGAFILRRTRFATMRLKDVAALRGASGLVKSLQQTTIQVAVLGGAVGVMGFGWAMLTRDWTNMLRAAGVSVVVLVYCFPFRSAWERVVRMLAPPDSPTS
ncbi:MAG: hypothetical protein DMF72_08065 [Acidobacteria bacterium]|nr:MAG: hypothetical protein DMF72_08065 [Acidobacteriota bacterium]